MAGELSEIDDPSRLATSPDSKHLKALERAGLVRRTVRDRTHYCQINPKPLAESDAWLKPYERLWGKRLEALAAFLRHPEKTDAIAD